MSPEEIMGKFDCPWRCEWIEFGLIPSEPQGYYEGWVRSYSNIHAIYVDSVNLKYRDPNNDAGWKRLEPTPTTKES